MIPQLHIRHWNSTGSEPQEGKLFPHSLLIYWNTTVMDKQELCIIKSSKALFLDHRGHAEHKLQGLKWKVLEREKGSELKVKYMHNMHWESLWFLDSILNLQSSEKIQNIKVAQKSSLRRYTRPSHSVSVLSKGTITLGKKLLHLQCFVWPKRKYIFLLSCYISVNSSL